MFQPDQRNVGKADIKSIVLYAQSINKKLNRL